MLLVSKCRVTRFTGEVNRDEEQQRPQGLLDPWSCEIFSGGGRKC